MKEAIFIVGILLITSGIAIIYWPAALIFLGVVSVIVAVLMAMYSARKQKPPSKD